MINKRLLNMLNESKKYIAFTTILNWLALLANATSLYFIGSMLEKIFNKTITSQYIYTTLTIIILAIIIRYVCRILSTKTSFLASSKVKKTLREKIYKKTIYIGASYNEKVTTSELVQVSVEGVEQLETFFGGYLPQLFYSLIAPFTLFIILSFVNFKSAIILLLCVPLIPISIVAVQKFAKKLLNKYWGIYTNMGDSFLENIQGLTTLKIYQRDKDKSDDMDIEAEKFRKVTMRVLTMQLNSISVMDLIAFGGAAVGTIVALSEFMKGNIGLAGVFLIIMLSAEFFIPLRLLGSFFHIAMNGMAASEKIFNILDLEVPPKGEINIGNSLDSVEFSSVGFSYNQDRKILDNISFKVSKGQLVSFVGESGSGKSTIAKLVMGINKGYTGDVLISSGQDICQLSSINEQSYLKNITLVDNNSYVFKGTIRDNLAMGNTTIKESTMYDALKKVNLYDFVMSINGLDSQLQEGGSNISGGQKQRLVLARSLLRDSHAYVFDEVTSNIDMDSEQKIVDVIYELAQKKLVIMISHRLANVVGSDKIFVLKDGNVVESGSHKELLQDNSLYKQLYKSQSDLEQYGKKGDKNNA